MLQQIRLLILDLDYLVFDCSVLKMQALKESLISYSDLIPQNVSIPDAVDLEESFMTHGFRWFSELQLGLDDKQMEFFEASYRLAEKGLIDLGVGHLYPGLAEALSSFREQGLQIALGVEGSREYLLDVSDRHDLDRFFSISLCTEEFGIGGAAEMFEEMLHQAEANPSEALVLGTRSGYFDSARSVDVLSIGCGWGIHGHASLAESDFQALALAQLAPIIEKADVFGSGLS